MARLALELAREKYGEALLGLALVALKPEGACRPYVEVYVFLDELPLEEVDYASELLERLPSGSYAGASVFVYTSRALDQASPELLRALAGARVAYDRDGRLKSLAEGGRVR